MHRLLLRLGFLMFLGLSLCPLGCRYTHFKELPQTGATLEGTVTYGKDKLMAALIIVQGADGAATGNIGDDGHYKIENVPLGEVNIGVNTDAAKGQMMSQVMAQSQSKEKDKKPLPQVIDVPAKFGNPTTSGIKTTINKGSNTFDIVVPK